MGREIKEKNIAIAIILSIVTCGIYGIIWLINMVDDVSYLSEDNNTTGVKVFLLSLVTCSIYEIYWFYKAGKAMNEVGTKRGVQISDNSMLYIILSIFGLSIVNYCLIQNDLNKFATPVSNQQ